MSEQKWRVEKDSMGEMHVPADKMWGASTQRSLQNFQVGTEKIPAEIVEAYVIQKKAVTIVNMEMNLLNEVIGNAIVKACDDALGGKLAGNFPLPVWQTGSGTQFNSNVSEVLAFRANQILAEEGKSEKVHPNDHVNLQQSSNDLYPSAMHMVGVDMISKKLIPALEGLQKVFAQQAKEYDTLTKSGRTHFMDAIPITFGQEVSAWERMLERNVEYLKDGIKYLEDIGLGGMVLGTGLTTKKGFDANAIAKINELTGYKFKPAVNKFQSLTSKSEIAVVHGMLKALAGDLTKIANDIRILSSGPRCGIGEITVPMNEPGSVIQPGKVNPTQCEALNMVCAQVFGNDTTISYAASQGILQLNIYMPVISYNFIQSIRILSDMVVSFTEKCAIGINPNKEKMKEYLDKTLMISTALVPLMGYDKATAIIKIAVNEGITLKEAALNSGWITEEEYDKNMNPENMCSPS